MNIDYKTGIKVNLGFEKNPSRPVTSYSQLLRDAKCEEMHAHPRAQLLFAHQGIMKVVIAHQIWVVTPLQGIWIPGGVSHQVFFPKDVWVKCLFIDESVLTHTPLPQQTFAFDLTTFLKCLVGKLISYGNPAQSTSPQKRLVDVLLDELSMIKPSHTFLPTSDDPRIKQVTDTLITDLSRNYTLEECAKKACVSTRTLSRVFVKQLSMSFGEWKLRLKMIEAIRLLGEGQPVKSIAYDLGYESASSFIHAFKNIFGKTPTKYLNQSSG
mgnify:CR=1 FL=1